MHCMNDVKCVLLLLLLTINTSQFHFSYKTWFTFSIYTGPVAQRYAEMTNCFPFSTSLPTPAADQFNPHGRTDDVG